MSVVTPMDLAFVELSAIGRQGLKLSTGTAVVTTRTM
jgi:hypothetical protein